MRRVAGFLVAVAAFGAGSRPVAADTTVFFRDCQVATPVSSGVTSETFSSNGYLFTATRDKLFTGGTGQPIGRALRVEWPAGVEAQAVTTPPPGVIDYNARIILQRVDGQVFDLPAFTAKLLANTAGAGAAIEIMPLLNGEDGFPDPLMFDASGYYGQTFSYDTSPNPQGSTALLVGFDTYKITLYVDYALVALTLQSAVSGPRSCCLPGPSCADLDADACALQGGVAKAGGTSCSCDPCLAAPAPPPVPDGTSGTAPLLAGRLDATGTSIRLSWDATTCAASDYNLLYGDLAAVASVSPTGSVCAIGTSGVYDWTGAPASDLWLLIVGTDGAGTESSWGLDGAGQERHGASSSGACGVTLKDTSRTCP